MTVLDRRHAERVDRVAAFVNPYPDRWAWLECACRDDGPWNVYGPMIDRYYCSRCGFLMELFPL